MNRINQVNPANATGKSKQLLDAVQAKLGIVPNLYRVYANSPAAFESVLNFSAALSSGTFDAKLREQIALIVAEINDCEYCLAAHTFIGGKVGLSASELIEARLAQASTPRVAAILGLARDIVVQRGKLSDADLQDTRDAGLTDADIVETVANVVINIFTNYTNHVARTALDFPAAPALEPVAEVSCTTAGCGCGH